MTVKVKDKATGGVMDIVSKMKAKSGEKSVLVVGSLKSEDDSYEEADRLPSGVFAFDYATGGGFPTGKISILTGPEGAGKTNLTLSAINQAQLIDPDKYQVFVDIENHFDPQWASHFITDMDRLLLVKVENGEDAVNKVEALMMAHDVNCIVVDSLAMLVPENELESDAGKQAVGGASAIIGKMMRKITARLSALSLANVYPTVICINQIRFKIGVMFGNPESQPGGMAPKHMSGLTCRLYGRDVTAEKDPTVYWREMDMVIQKKKVPTLSKKASWKLCVDVTPAGDKIGSVEDWNLIVTLMKTLGFLVQDKAGWLFLGELYKTQAELKEYLTNNQKAMQNLKIALIEREKQNKLGVGNGTNQTEPVSE
jgi:recombination protein RecA